MVRKGSTVRVRQRALRKPRSGGVFRLFGLGLEGRPCPEYVPSPAYVLSICPPACRCPQVTSSASSGRAVPSGTRSTGCPTDARSRRRSGRRGLAAAARCRLRHEAPGRGLAARRARRGAPRRVARDGPHGRDVRRRGRGVAPVRRARPSRKPSTVADVSVIARVADPPGVRRAGAGVVTPSMIETWIASVDRSAGDAGEGRWR